MDRHIARTIVRNSAGDARVIWCIFSGYHPYGLRESGAAKEAFQRVVLGEIWMTFSQDKTQGRS